MLVYHPAFDIYNCIFRLLQLLSNVEEKEIEVERLRIWDFYLTFPKEAAHIRFPRDLNVLKELIFKTKEPNPYEDLVDSRKIIDRMKSYQLSALNCLASYGFVDSEKLSKNIVRRTKKEIPEELMRKLTDLSVEKANIIKLVTGFVDLPLHGAHGLKSRTGLIDFKYDAN